MNTKRILTAAAVIGTLALSAPAASARVHIVTPDGATAEPYQAWADSAAEPTVDGDVTIAISDYCAPAIACTSAQTPNLINLRPDISSPRYTMLHELGHLFDYQRMTPQTRGTFLAITHRAGPWRQEGSKTSPHEQFAEAYAACAALPWLQQNTRRARWWWHSTRGYFSYGYEPGFFRHRKVCDLIRRAAS